MKALIISSLMIVLGFCAQNLLAQEQTEKSDTKSKRELRREIRKAEQEAREVQLMQMLRDTTFVFEISTLYGFRGDSYRLNPLSNFFAVIGRNASIQYAFNQFPGFSGIEGMHNTGELIAYELTKPGKNKPLLVKGRISPYSSGSMVLFEIFVQKNGRALMDMTTASGRRIKLEGDLIMPANSKVFKTMPLIRHKDTGPVVEND